MSLRHTFQSIIALHQNELPYSLKPREVILPVDKEGIITVTGVRRCGKSSLLKLAVNQLIASGVEKERILFVEFDDERFSGMGTEDFDKILSAYREMYPTRPLKDAYLFFDEIQLIKGWELFILRIYKNYCPHIFITGSTAEMLSGEMASALRGYPDEYREQVLSFEEYLNFKDVQADGYTEEGKALIKSHFKDYCRDGGFPKVALTTEKSEKVKLLQTYFNTMLFRDMVEHYNIKSSIAVVKYFLKRVMENLSKPTSVNNIYNELKSMGMKVGKDYLYDWLNYACQSFLFYRVSPYTASVLKESSGLAKYYVADTGLRNSVLEIGAHDDGKSLENIVFMKLHASLGEEDKISYFNEGRECDFVVQRAGVVTELVQVCWSLDKSNRNREYAGLYAASQATGCRACRIVTFEQTETVEYKGLTITVTSIV